jgi:hypothetical protein
MQVSLILALFLNALLGVRADDQKLPELAPDVFRFLRTEQQTFPPIIRDGEPPGPAHTVTYGVFAFRYHSAPLEFWGFDPPEGNQFTTRFTQYLVRRKSGWSEYPIGYCGFGEETYRLEPDTDYELRIYLSLEHVAGGQQMRVSADTKTGIFWSEPFKFPSQ